MSQLAGVFKNTHDSVRIFWKLFLMFLIAFGGTVIVGVWVGLFDALTHLATMKTTSTILQFVQELCEIGAVFIMVYVFEKSRMRHFGFPMEKRVSLEVIYGILWGAVSMILIFIVFRAAGLASLTQPLSHPHWSGALVWTLILMILVGCGEEMMVRGYTLTLLYRQTGKKWVSIGVSALIFAGLHLMNPHVSILAFVNLVLYAIVASFMYLRSGSLWMPIAYHATWDYFEGDVFGFPNSGNVMPSLYSFSHVTPNIVTGGSFGPEGGLIVTVVLLITLFWTVKLYRPDESLNLEKAIEA